MKKLIMVVFLVTFAAVPPWVQAAQRSQAAAQGQDDKEKKDKDKTVPEPGTMLLVGAAGVGLWGARKVLRSKRR